MTDNEVFRLKRLLLENRSVLDLLLVMIIETGCRGHDAVKLRLNDIVGGLLTDPTSKETIFVATVNLRSRTKRGLTGSYDLTPQFARAWADFLTRMAPQLHGFNPLLIELAVSTTNLLSAKKALRRHLRSRCLEAGIEPFSNLHAFRHRVADKMYRATGNLLYVQKILRHKSISSTQHYLGKFDFEAAQNELRKLNTVEYTEKPGPKWTDDETG